MRNNYNYSYDRQTYKVDCFAAGSKACQLQEICPAALEAAMNAHFGRQPLTQVIFRRSSAEHTGVDSFLIAARPMDFCCFGRRSAFTA